MDIDHAHNDHLDGSRSSDLQNFAATACNEKSDCYNDWNVHELGDYVPCCELQDVNNGMRF